MRLDSVCQGSISLGFIGQGFTRPGFNCQAYNAAAIQHSRHTMVNLESQEIENNHKALRRHAIMLLTRREHSTKELLQKLVAKGYDADAVQNLLQVLIQEGLQSDERFAESYLRFRREKGFGPIHILQELQQRGVSQAIIATVLDMQDIRWLEYLQRVRIKRFGQEYPQNIKDHARQCRFLAYRGYSQDQIASVLSDEGVF